MFFTFSFLKTHNHLIPVVSCLLFMVAHLQQNSVNGFYMLKKWIIDVHQMIFICSTNCFYIQQMTFTFNKKFIYSAIWNFCSVAWGFIFNSLRFAFNKMKFIKLKSFAFSKPSLDVTKYTSNSIRQNERSGL